jgi:hypothetical protein
MRVHQLIIPLPRKKSSHDVNDVFEEESGLSDTPEKNQADFLQWKRQQGRATAGSTYALMYNLDNAPSVSRVPEHVKVKVKR